MSTAYDFTADELAPETLIHCAGCDRNVEPHALITCDHCGAEVCCAKVETLSTGDAVLCKRCDDGLMVCEHCGEYAFDLEEIASGDESVGHRETLNLCSACAPKRRVA